MRLFSLSRSEKGGVSLPRTLLREDLVINTNGVYCDAMIGQCSALDEYLAKHRDLDLLEKKIAVGNKELDFKLAVASGGMVEMQMERDRIIGVVRPPRSEETSADEIYSKRLEVQKAELQESGDLHTAGLDKLRGVEEINMLRKRIEELDKKIQEIGKAKKHEINVPTGVEAKVDVHLTGNEDGEEVDVSG